MSGLGMDSAPNSVFRILGASPKFKIIEFYGLVRVLKHYSLVALFVALSASLEGPKNGKKSAQVYPEHPSSRGMGAEADDLHLSDLINGRTEGNILNSKSIA